jgi:hypothetical protein
MHFTTCVVSVKQRSWPLWIYVAKEGAATYASITLSSFDQVVNLLMTPLNASEQQSHCATLEADTRALLTKLSLHG